MRRRSIACAAALLSACHPEPDVAPEADEAAEVRNDGAVAIRPERRCGEAGPRPTALPPDLEAGMELLGAATLRRGEVRSLDTIALAYDAAVSFVPAYATNLDMLDVAAGRMQRVHVREAENHVVDTGAHIVDVRVGEQDPPLVRVEVTRPRCPAEALMQQGGTAQSMWLSTEAIRDHEIGGEQLSVELVQVYDHPMIRISEGHYGTLQRVYPWTKMQVRANTHVVRIEEVVPGPGTRYDGMWTARMRPKLHVRVDVEPAVPQPVPDERTPAKGCGTATLSPTAIPGALQRVPPIVDEYHLGDDEIVEMGPFKIAVQLGDWDGYARVYLPDAGEQIIVPSHRVLRRDRALLVVEKTGDGHEIHARRLRVACSQTLALDVDDIDEPRYLWLSSIGHETITIGSPPQLSLDLEPHTSIPTLRAYDTDRVYTATVAPSIVGDAFTVGEWIVEVVDVTSSYGTGFREDEWHSRSAVPAVHVQLRISEAA